MYHFFYVLRHSTSHLTHFVLQVIHFVVEGVATVREVVLSYFQVHIVDHRVQHNKLFLVGHWK